MVMKKYTITRIDLEKDGWDVNKTAEFYGVTPGEFLAGLDHHKYPEGEIINGRMFWHPGILKMFKDWRETGFVPRIIGAGM
jgi:hypothetical protein